MRKKREGSVSDGEPASAPTPNPSSEDGFEPAVGWLLGSQLLASLRRILLHQIYSERLDHRDWMQGNLVDRSSFGRRVRVNGETVEEYWFDYVADTGDCERASYSIACLCLDDLAVCGDGGNKRGDAVKLARYHEGKSSLPRGDFLLVGGDTAYPIADRRTLERRFRDPFHWAFVDLSAKGRPPETRPLLGIPGNHDYYDALDGFNRQFRTPATNEDRPDGTAGNRVAHTPELPIDGFVRVQNASYVAVRLPCKWWLLALDTENRKVDYRQKQFFRGILRGTCEGHDPFCPPKRLVVATPNPTTAFGHPANEDASRPFRQLDLPCLFSLAADHDPVPPKALEPDECRLDISGNFHHYERYWGAAPPEAEVASSKCTNYASVVSGGGGAFLHPTHARSGPVQPECTYPDQADSRRLIAEHLLRVRSYLKGGFVRIVGFWLAAMVYLATLAPHVGGAALAALGEGGVSSRVRVFRALTAIGPTIGWAAVVVGMVALLAAGTWWARRVMRLRGRWSRKWYALREAVTFSPSSACVAVAFTLPGVVSICLEPPRALDVFALLVGGAFWVGMGFVAPLSLGAARRSRGIKALFVGFGVVHATAQLVTPTLLVRWFSGIGLAVAVLAVVIFGIFGKYTLLKVKSGAGVCVFLLWVVLIGVVHGGAWYCHTHWPWAPPWLMNPFWGPWVAGLVGVVFSSVWFAWYLAVSICFKGHVNEAGIVARVDGYKQMIRFRVTNHDITGYVIGIDSPVTKARGLEARIVDVFRVAPRNGGADDSPSAR